MASTAILTNKREKNLTWITWSLTTGFGSYNFCNVHINCGSAASSLFFRWLLHLKIWTKLHSYTHKNHQRPKPQLWPPLPPTTTTKGQILRVAENQNHELNKNPGTQQNNVQFQHQLQHHAMDNVSVQASRVLSNNPGTENSPIMIKILREIFWMTTFEVVWMTLRRIHITWKVWSMFPKITAFFFTQSL